MTPLGRRLLIWTLGWGALFLISALTTKLFTPPHSGLSYFWEDTEAMTIFIWVIGSALILGTS